jgi:hypothetical protein
VAGVAPCRDLEVQPAGSVKGALVLPPRTLQVTGSVTNHGSVGTVNPFYLDVEIGGDLHNAGAWTPGHTRLIGAIIRHLSQDEGHGLVTDLAYAIGASGDVVATTPIALSGSVDMSGGRMVLEPDGPLTLDAASFRGNLTAGGNELRFVAWSYLWLCAIDDVVLVGPAKASGGVTVTTRLTVMDSLENGGTGGGGSVTVVGDLVNNGIIRNVQYSFPLYVAGDIENNGTISNPTLELTGVGIEHRLSMGPDAVISAPIFLPEFQASTLIADTPLRLAGGLGLGVGTLVLEPGCSLEFTDWGGIGSGTVLAGGNSISVSGNGSVSGVTIDRGVLGDRVVVQGANTFTGGLTVTGTVTSWPWADAHLTVESMLRNEGTIEDGDHPVRVTALGDIANTGSFTNSRVTLAGADDQTVGIGPLGLAVPEFVIESGLAAGSHQWYRDGAHISGETGADLVLSMLDATDYGSYHCEADGQVSRSVVIAASLAPTGVPSAGAVTLAPNHPNPFNPATNFSFTLDRAARVSLSIYDLAGRVVARLIDGELARGRHDLAWRPQDLPSGTYVYRLRAGAADLTGKCMLLK